ncbi:MAG: hypothetical protein A3K19_19365 [Lentisphaerae bacterium RIFOXYB12_FULL_65_16]|nr:MAG: hypothetical protein A3K18_00120 [Lentisphaerae bacterium RIFOXYA12_64_32]OGV84647.1 MAG: hypothetical protein A3K19_19365 [Lentisphaerae bacterium RIFOXYB12_FULL_65_16]
MNVLLVLVTCVVVLVVVGTWYSRFLARTWGEDPTAVTPAVRFNDGRDYVPTPTPVVFAHHFASIAGAGPILGPVLAMCYGWGPALLWVMVGGLFIGALHDYLAAHMSIRHGGRSVAMIMRHVLGRGPFIAFMVFLVLMLGLVTAVFLNTSAVALVSMIELGRMKLPETQTLFRIVEAGGQQKVIIGGVASTSVIVVTVFAPLVGWLYIKKQVAVWKCSLLAIFVCVVSIVVGLYVPVSLGKDMWKTILALYTLFAAGVPVWMFLQSRDFINVHVLYAGVLLLIAILVTASLRSGAPPPTDVLPIYDGEMGMKYLGWLWPALFTTIACGAVSGFHSLCAGGTTCKQLKSETAVRYIGYWGMLLETLLAVAVITVVVVGTTRGFYFEDVFPPGKENNPVLGFAFAVGRAGHNAFGMPIAAGALAGMLLLEGFVITTLDTAIRLNRYLIEEVWQEVLGRFDVFAERAEDIMMHEAIASEGDGEMAGSSGIPAKMELPEEFEAKVIPTSGLFRAFLRVLTFYWVNSGIAVGLMLWLSFSAGILQLWKVFGTANQLLAAFVLSLGAIWLLRNGRKVWYVVVPALFMLVTTFASLFLLIGKYRPRTGADGLAAGVPTLFVSDLVLLVLTVYLVVMGAREFLRLCRKTPAAS